MKTLSGLAPALGLALACAWPAAASGATDVADWALPEASLAIVFRGADTLPARLDALAARFPGAERLTRDFAAIRALDLHGFRPGQDLLAGMDPSRGVALFADAAGRVRLVAGATDGERLRQSMAAVAAALDTPIVLTDDGFGGPTPLPCIETDGLMICDTQGPPKTAPGRPAELGGDTWLTVRLSGAALLGLPQPLGSMVSSVQVDVRAEAERITARGALAIRPDMQPMYAEFGKVLRPTTGASATAAMHPRTPFVFKLSLDAQTLLDMTGGGLPPDVVEKVKPIVRHWSGELGLSFVGSYAEPVLTLGLGEGSTGADLIDAVLALPPPDMQRPERKADALIFRTEPDPELGDAPLAFTVHHRTVGRHLLVGVDPIDLQRVERERGTPPNLPPALAARGGHGAFIAHVPLSAATGAGEFMRVELPAEKRWTALLGWLQTEAYLMDGIWSLVSLDDDAVRVELGWSRL